MSKKLDQIGGAVFIVLCIIAVMVSIFVLIYFMPGGSSDDTSEETIGTIVMDKADSTGDISTKDEKTVETSTPDNKETELQQPSASVENDSELEKDIYDEHCPEDLSYAAWYYGEGAHNHDEALVIEDSNGSFYMPRSSNYEEWFADHVDNCPYAFHDGPDYGIPDWLYKQLLDSRSDDVV